MRRRFNTLLIIGLLCLPTALTAQERDDSRYLDGAVPEVNGKVAFSKEFNIVGMSKAEIMSRTEAWMDAMMKANKNASRIVLTDEAAGNIVGNADHYIVFSSSGLSLDRTRMQYLLTATASDENLKLEINRIRYVYNDTGKENTYPAEEMISDEYAMNKAHTKLVRGVAKFRRKTVDYVDSIFVGAANMLKSTAEDNRIEQTARSNSRQETVVVINNNPRNQEVAAAAPQPAVAEDTKPVVTEEPKPVLKEEPKQETVAPTPSLPEGYELAEATELSSDMISAGNGKLVIAIGSDIYNMTTITANAGGSLSQQNGKTVVYTILSPDQDASLLTKAETYSVRFYPNGTERPSLILECKKMPSQQAMEGMPQIFAGEVLRALKSK